MPGTITFKPIEANLNHDSDIIGKADPYCMFLVGDQRIKGQVCKSGGKHPIWDDAVTVPTGSQSICTVELKDKDTLKDDKLGSFEIDLREVESQGRLKKWYPIFYNNKPAGEILMEAIFSPGQGMGGFQQQGMPLQQGMGGFQQQGMPLQQGMGGFQQQGMPLQQGFQQHSIPVQQHHVIGVAPVSGVTQTQVVTKETVIVPTQQTFVQNQGYSGYPQTGYGESLSDQYAREALIRGVDPLGTHLHHPSPLNNSQYNPLQQPLNHQGVPTQIAPNSFGNANNFANPNNLANPNNFSNPNNGMNMPPNQF